MNMYRINDPPFVNLIKEWTETANSKIKSEYSSKAKLIETILNLDYKIASPYMSVTLSPNMGKPPRRSEILISAYHRNWFAFSASYELTINGLFGPARSILRHAFESMIIAKFCSLSKDDKVYERWRNGDTVYFTNSVLKKISTPDTKTFSEFWGALSNYVHATIYAQQFSLEWEHVDNQARFNLDLILVLLEWHYHILTSHIVTPATSSQTIYNVGLFGNDKLADWRQSKKELRVAFKNAKKDMPDFMKKAVRDFKQTWVLYE
jgi:hypothetical protein